MLHSRHNTEDGNDFPTPINAIRKGVSPIFIAFIGMGNLHILRGHK